MDKNSVKDIINDMLDNKLDEALEKRHKNIPKYWFTDELDGKVFDELAILAMTPASEIDTSQYVQPKYQKYVTSIEFNYKQDAGILSSSVFIVIHITPVAKEALLAKQLAEAKRVRDKKVTKATEEIHDLIFHLLEDKLVQAVSDGDNEVRIVKYLTEGISSEALKKVLKLSDVGELSANDSPYIPSVIQPYLESFRVTYHNNIGDDPYLILQFTIKD